MFLCPINRLGSLPAYNRVSIRAVLVHDGEEPGPALAAAGITNPIAIPVVAGDDFDLAGGILGDGVTPNLIGLLETEQDDDFGASAGGQPGRSASRADVARPAAPVTTTAPDTFGMRPFAPIGRLDDSDPHASAIAVRVCGPRRAGPRPGDRLDALGDSVGERLIG